MMKRFFSLLWLISPIVGFHLNIIDVLVSDKPANGVRAIAPAIDVALDRLLPLYPHFRKNFTRKRLYKFGPLSCYDYGVWLHESIGELLNRLSDENALNVVLDAGEGKKLYFYFNATFNNYVSFGF